ncbi:MAG: GNAT family N-acetyltransferase [Demequinaceae bacterium]|nr:GNAT family N-acetyltransferase [Demequinaceae bacterium]
MTRSRPRALACGDVVVRPLRRKDEAAWLDLRERNRAWLRPWEATDPPGRMARGMGFGAMVRRDRLLWRRGRSFNMVIVVHGQLVGRVCITGIEWGSARTGSLGYWIDEKHAGRGIVPFAAALLTQQGFDLGLHRIEIATRPENQASLTVVNKLGFRDEGLRKRYLYVDGGWRDHRVFALTVDEKRTGEYWEMLKDGITPASLA